MSSHSIDLLSATPPEKVVNKIIYRVTSLLLDELTKDNPSDTMERHSRNNQRYFSDGFIAGLLYALSEDENIQSQISLECQKLAWSRLSASQRVELEEKSIAADEETKEQNYLWYAHLLKTRSQN